MDRSDPNLSAAFYGGQYYTVFDSFRQSIGNFYGPESSIYYDGMRFIGQDAIVAFLNELGATHHNITTVGALVEPSTGRLNVTFLGDYVIAGQQTRNFSETFSLEAGRRIVFSIFCTFPEPALDLPSADQPTLPPADQPLVPGDLPIPPPPPPGDLLVPVPAPWIQENGPIAVPPALADGTPASSTSQGSNE